jgi:hypothetical protein
VNGQKVIEESSGTIVVSADVDQSLTVKTTGTGQSTLQSNTGVNLTATGSGDVTLTTASGNIEAKGNLQILTGKQITDSASVKVQFGDNIDMNNNSINELGNPSVGTDAANKTYVDTEIAALANSAPVTLNTLNELAAALGDDANFSTTLTTNLGQKLGGTATVTLTGDITASATAFSSNTVSLATSLAADSVDSAEIAASAVGASELNVTGNGTTSQFLRSDADGSMTWAVPTDTNTTYAVGDGGLTQINFTSADNTKLDAIEASADVTDTTNVTSAGALMDSEVTNLASVKAFATTDYATAAQGTTADNALPKAGGAMTGAITTNSTFDGVDIATRDGVLTSTTTTANAALPKAGGAMTGAITTNSTFDGRDVATDGTKLDGIEASADVTDVTNVTAAGALMDSELAGLAAVKATTGTFLTADQSKLDGIASSATNVTNNNQITNGAGYITSYTNTTYSAGSGLDISGTTFSVEPDLRDGITHVGLDAGDYIGWTNNSHQSFFVNAGERVRIEVDGDIHADGDLIAYSTTISDRRLKDNIQPIENALDKVRQLNGCTFTYIADGKDSAGLIAQDVEKVLPSAVTEKELPLKMDDGKEYKVLQYDQIIGLLVESIKEQQVQIEELQAKIK